MRYIILVIATTIIVTACGILGKDKKADSENYSIETAYLDESISPKEDFFMYANGTWVKNNPVPDSESRWGSFNELEEQNNLKLTKILEKAKSGTHEKGSIYQLIGDYYASFMDLEARDSKTDEVVESIVGLVKQITSKKHLAALVGRLHSKGIPAFFNFGVQQDMKNIDQHVASISQGGLGLPNKTYYSDENKIDILKKYLDYAASLFEMTGISEGAYEMAQSAVSIEEYLAKFMMEPSELRVPENTYNPTSRDKFISSLHGFNMSLYFQSMDIRSFDTLIVGQPEYFPALSELINSTSLTELKNYLTLRLLNHYAPHLGENFIKIHFDFYGTTLSGTKKMKPMNERAIKEITGSAIKDALGEAFVNEHFSVEAKDKVNDMVDKLLIVYRDRLKNLEWMSETTKKEALTKLESIGRKLGFPEEFEDLSGIKIKSDDYVGNVDQCNYYSVKRNIKKLNKPVDRSEWGMPAHMVNAYYHPLLNEIAFPAGIMQPPFFDIKAEDAVNYGSIGMVIGHEFTHGFDDMGSKFAADGSFTNWWTEEDRDRFEERTGKLGKTYEGFCPIDGHCVNPDLTMGENIADLGGITMAYHAYAMTEEYKSSKKVNGFTPSQRFFLSYAQLWKINYTDEELKKRIATDPHSPGMYRVNGPLMNSPEFFEAFDVKEGDPMRNSEANISRIW